MTATPKLPALPKDTLRDFSANPRLLVLSVMAAVVGSFGAGAAWVLLKLIMLATNLAYFHRFSVAPVDFATEHLSVWSIGVPVLGGLIVGLMARFGSEKIRGHGIPEAIEAILIGQSRIQAKVAILKPLSSAVAIGTGGPFGAEGPIIMTGGAVGSLFAQMFNLSSAERKTLLVAGAAAGMTAVFGTPIAAVLLAVELLLFEWKPRSFIPVAAAAVIAFAWRPFLIGAGPLFPYLGTPDLPWWGLAACALIGIVAGAQSSLMTVCLYRVEDLFRRLPVHWMWWPAIGGLVVGIGGYFEPAALGVGYENIRGLLAGQFNLDDAGLLLLVKAAIWIVALSSGTSGGVLAPLLIMGGALGAIEAHILPFGDAGFWALLGMSSILGGTMRAPLTATMFAVELTGNTHMLAPLLVAAVGAFGFTVLVMRRSILTERIARRGLHLSREYTVDPFSVMRVSSIMAKPAESLPGSMRVSDVMTFFDAPDGVQRHRSYPIVDENQRVIGMVSRSDVLRWSREGWTETETLADKQERHTLLTAYDDDLVGDIADQMATADIARVPVISRATNTLVGLVARRDLLRVRLHTTREEHERGAGRRFCG
jgi:H+/Cl- antiporter ClcA/predicted transcriptional regulator